MYPYKWQLITLVLYFITIFNNHATDSTPDTWNKKEAKHFQDFRAKLYLNVVYLKVQNISLPPCSFYEMLQF